MPWQQHVADVVMELDPDTGQLVYSEVGLTVPRQSGKSTLLLAKAAHRASALEFFGPRQHLLYTAQTRKDARKKFEEDYAGVLEASRYFRSRADCRWGNGNEHIRFPNGSRFAIEATTEKAGHGTTLDEGYIDEAFSQVDNRTEQAFGPAMITRRNTQLWVVSTAGWLNGSPFLEAKVARGRASAEAGVTEGLAYFEWSAPEDAEPEDQDLWPTYMPALGHTISAKAILRQLHSMNPNGFRRAYMNLWVPKDEGESGTIPFADWQACLDQRSRFSASGALGVAMTPDRGSITVVGASERPDGRIHTEILAEFANTDEALAWLLSPEGRKRDAPVLIDTISGAATMIRPLEEAGVEVPRVGVAELHEACGLFFDSVRQHHLAHVGQPTLDSAVRTATTRETVRGAWAWRRNGEPIASLEAASLARWAIALYPVYDLSESVL